MDALPHHFRKRGAALIIVLAFVVLLTGLVLAYFSRTSTDRQVAHVSFNQTKVDQVAASAMDLIIGGIRQEITGPSPTPTPPYVPATNANMVPVRFGNLTGSPNPIPNMVRRSIHDDAPTGANPIPAPGIPSLASAVNSAPVDPANPKRGEITLARWNKHYLIPKADPSNDKSDPANFVAPDWVILTRDGAVAFSTWNASLKDQTPTNNSYAVGRYAYAIYDIGGLLDMNVAGYPSGTTAGQYGPKGSLAFADLTTLPSPTPTASPIASPILNGPSPLLYQADTIVGWRNYVTTLQSATSNNNFPDTAPASQAFARNFQASASPATTYYNYIVNNNNGFLGPSPTVAPNGRTDQALVNRQQLIAFRNTLSTNNGTSIPNTSQFGSTALQYLATFSRETAIPQWSPTIPTAINPNFQTLLVTTSFARNDGTTANVGDYLVNKRFSLPRLNWLTYKGPSATRTIPVSAPAIGNADYDMWLLTSRFGLTSTYLGQGTDLSQAGQTATTAKIYKYFGLVWDTANERWNYIGHPVGASATSPLATSIATVGTLTGTREPDFFELLQAGILNSSLADSAAADPVLPIIHQQSTMLHLITIGANLIAQSRADSYPVRIACSVDIGGGNYKTMEAVGAPRLPYLNSLAACPAAGTGVQGGVNWLLVPNLWDPVRDTWDLSEKNVSSTLTPGYLRPTVRITVSGSVGFGTIVSSASVKSGSVPSASVTPFPSPVLSISPSQSLNLTRSTPTPTPSGRDGFLEPSRIDTSDATPTPSPFVTTTSASPTPFAQWNNVPYPSPTPNPTPIGANIVFRISLPGSGIPDTALSPAQNPVLILKPGFQVTLDYQSPTISTKWYSYTYLQGNNEPSTWISGSNALNPSMNLTTTASVYGRNPAPSPTPPPPPPTPTPRPSILSSGVATIWNLATLSPAPMFARADPRSIRYDSQIGVVNLTTPPSAAGAAAGAIGSIWPSAYATPPAMTVASAPTATPATPTPIPTPTITPTPSPTPTVTPNAPNPATLGDNALAGNAANAYSESGGSSWRPLMMNRPFRSVGEMAYAFRDQPFKTLDFSSANSPDAGLLDLFCVNDYNDASSRRAGVINLNSQQAPGMAAVLAGTFTQENTPRSAPTPSPSVLLSSSATPIAASLALQTSTTPLVNRANLAAFIANNQTTLGPSVPKTQRESIARALAEVGQTRTWNLLIDVIAQSGRYPPNASALTDFLVEGEQHYWVHVAIDRFTGQVIDKQIEVVNE